MRLISSRSAGPCTGSTRFQGSSHLGAPPVLTRVALNGVAVGCPAPRATTTDSTSLVFAVMSRFSRRSVRDFWNAVTL